MTDPFDGKAYVRGLTHRPGVYRMLGAQGEVLYVGKARDLRKRVASYFRPADQLGPKSRALVGQIATMETTVTRTEGEALLLESNLIKELRPRFNVVFRDDKSYPYIHLTGDHEFARLAFHRGARSAPGRYFGPYPNAGAVRATLNLLQKLFQIRSCEDSYFRNRSRPCLQHQIERCTAPCVGGIDADAYRQDVEHAVLFLEGRSQQVIDVLGARMEEAAGRLEFERAAHYRDRIRDLQRVQQRQYMSGEGGGDVDVLAAATGAGQGCVQVFFIRNGQNLGNKTFFPGHGADADAAELLGAFVAQYYLGGGEHAVPQDIILSDAIEDADLIAATLAERCGRKVRLHARVRGERARWVKMALENARIALAQREAERSGQARRLDALRELFDLDDAIGRIECFDISHTQGEATVASCVVFGTEGALKSDYRRFNIEDITPGDDYAAMRQAILRRYTRIKREEGKLPDLLLIDGGKGQVNEARQVLEELQIDAVLVVGVAKGPSRRAGLETLVLCDARTSKQLPPDSPALLLIQQVRDEAHRFAVTGHRQRRARARNTSTLEQIPGIGAKRRRQLIRHFGGLQGVSRAGVEDLSRVPGISSDLAQRIYDMLHAG
ncbi:MAG: excinuclease ABC subunit UvrC [Gammaproteobacteria bacterium]|nr:excinuclease ABC subunit UvrC [Gammaproteobacteria bacterium]